MSLFPTSSTHGHDFIAANKATLLYALYVPPLAPQPVLAGSKRLAVKIIEIIVKGERERFQSWEL